jgi:hypothetical protein
MNYPFDPNFMPNNLRHFPYLTMPTISTAVSTPSDITYEEGFVVISSTEPDDD